MRGRGFIWLLSLTDLHPLLTCSCCQNLNLELLTDRSGEFTDILDVLEYPDLTQFFIDQIMKNSKIEKVFHNASYDLKFLGNRDARNVTCTFKLAKTIDLAALGTPDRKLKTLAKVLCQFTEVDQEQQGSNWGQRPLNPKQLLYARMDTVYVAHVHQHLLQRTNSPGSFVNKPALTDSTAFSVTKVRVAFECARLFYLAHHFNSMTLFLPDNQALGIGNAFHDLSDQFVQTALKEPQFQALLSPPSEHLQVEEVAVKLRELFYREVFFPYLQSQIQSQPEKAQALHQLWQGLTSLIEHWAGLLVSNRHYCSAEAVFSKTFLAQELNVFHHFSLPNGEQQLVRGRLDSLVYDFAQHRLCVVEYKTYQSPDQAAQLAQVALYGYMLRQKIGVAIDSAVYSVLPDWKELTFTWDELESTVHQLIPHKLQQMQQWVNWQPGQPDPPPPTAQPHLCEICPQYQKCQTFFTDSSPVQSSPDFSEAARIQPQDQLEIPKSGRQKSGNQKSGHQKLRSQKTEIKAPAPASESPQLLESTGQNVGRNTGDSKPIAADPVATDTIAHQLVKTLHAFNVDVEYQGFVAAPAFIRVKLKPNLGVKVSAILKLSNDLRVQLGLSYPPLIAPQSGYVSVDLPRPDRQSAYFEQYIQMQNSLPSASTRIAIGVDLEGSLIEADLADPNTCHFLVGGTTGSGKSEFLRSILLSLLVRHSPHHLKIALVDPKRVTFPEFERIPWLYQPIVKESDRAIDLMENLVREMESRYQKFEVSGCSDLSGYNQKHEQSPEKMLPRIVCIFDEYADFMAEKETAKGLELSIKRLGAMARAAGIHLIIATQRPEAKIVTPVIRSNLPGRVALRTASEADSMIILGGKHTEAAYLLGKGDLLYQAGASSLRLQSLFAPQVEVF
ncbi:MAG: cell division protein FtsK [Cyanobacteria bacterium RM1_2_2]|nr:cell division protein FtsK [Cyanobacteria bacterium RM1_2_2]